MFVQALHTNFASPDGTPHTFALGQYTLVKGRNATGKSSSISHPLRLVLTGSTDDLNGKDEVRDPQVLAQYASSPDGVLYAHATFDDGTQGAWGTVRMPDGTVKTPRPEPPPGIDPDRVLPLRAIRAVLRGDEMVARRTFLGWIGQKVEEDAVLALIPSHFHPKYRDIAEKQQGSVTDRLIAVVEYAKARARQIESDAGAQDSLIASIQVDGTEPSKEEIEQARTLEGQWSDTLARAVAWEGRATVGNMGEIAETVREAEQAVAGWGAVIRAHAEEKPTPPSVQPVQNAHVLAGQLLDEAACAAGTCPACGATPGEVSLRAWAAYHQGQAKPPDLSTYRGALEAWERTQSSHQQSLQAWRVLLATSRETHARAVGAAGTTLVDPGCSAEQARAGLNASRAHLANLDRRAGAWAAVSQAREAASHLRSEKPVYESFARCCMEAVTALLETSMGKFCASAQPYLPERWQVGMRLHDQGKEVFQIGFREGARLRTNLSGGERDALCVAIAMVLAGFGGGVAPAAKKRGRPPARTPNGYFLVIPEDRNRDPETLGELMRAWSKFPGQVILESDEEPKGRFPAGWTLLDMDEWRAKFKKAEGGEKKAEKIVTAGSNGAGNGGEIPPVAPAAPPPLKKWYYHGESTSFARMTEAEWEASPEQGLLVEIEGTDDAAPDRYLALQDDPNVGFVGAGTPRRDDGEVLVEWGYKAAVVERMGPKLRALLVDEKVAADSATVIGQSCVIYNGKKKPSKTLPLEE